MKIKGPIDLFREHPELQSSLIPLADRLFLAFKLGHQTGEIAQLNAQQIKKEIADFQELQALSEREGHA